MLSGPGWERTENERKVCQALEKVAAEVGAESIQAGRWTGVVDTDGPRFLTSPTVAIAYVMQKAPYVFPIIGGRKVEHLKQNLQGLDVALSEEHIKYLESILPFDLGFPTGRFVSLYVL